MSKTHQLGHAMSDLNDQPEEMDSSRTAYVRIVSKNELCALLRISGALFDRLMRDGAPYIERGEKQKVKWRINVADFVRFMIEDAVSKAVGGKPDAGTMSLDEAKRKDKEVQANIRELELLKMQGEMVDVGDVRAVLRDTFAITRSRLLSVGTQVLGLSPNQQRDLDDALNDALTELSEDRSLNFKDSDEAAPELTQH